MQLSSICVAIRFPPLMQFSGLDHAEHLVLCIAKKSKRNILVTKIMQFSCPIHAIQNVKKILYRSSLMWFTFGNAVVHLLTLVKCTTKYYENDKIIIMWFTSR